MDYEKKYKETLERAKSIKDSIIASHNKESASYYTGFINNIFPELKESENERIRKELIEFLRCSFYVQDSGLEYEKIGEWVAWLEKQKEQKPTEDTALQKAFVISKIDYTLEEKCDASDYADAILPTSVAYGENEEEYKLHKIIEAAFIAGKKMAQKPTEWSEEDEKNFRSVRRLIEEQAEDPRYEEELKLLAWWDKKHFLLRPQPH